jgi:acyl carrier protein phosphodiesterase
MNFFGHAVLAAWRDDARAFVLGAMLPDFAAMIRARPPAASDPAIAAGIEFHHRTDEVFHRSAAFLALSRAALEWLSVRGVGRGSARAVAHIGVEMLLELPLARDARGQRAYLAALDGGADAELGRGVAWGDTDEIARFERLRRALLTRGQVIEDVATDVIAERLARALSSRPLLALDATAQLAVREWIASARADIASRAWPLVADLKSELSA